MNEPAFRAPSGTLTLTNLHFWHAFGYMDVNGEAVSTAAALTRRLSDADLAAVRVDDVEATTAQDAATAACDEQKSRHFESNSMCFFFSKF